MLIKLPNSIVNITQLSKLVTQLGSKQFNTPICESFFDANPRITKDPQAIEMVLGYFEKIIASPKILEITFAQSADEDYIIELTAWARTNIQENILLNIKVDPLLIGGVVVRSPRRIYDYSWENKLGEQREILGKLVTHVN